jgi:hypothetical protein
MVWFVEVHIYNIEGAYESIWAPDKPVFYPWMA